MTFLATLSSLFSYVCAILFLKPYSLLSRSMTGIPPPETYQQWYDLQDDLDEIHGVKEWASQDADSSYRYQNLWGFKTELESCRRTANMNGLCTALRYQSWSRNISNILHPALYYRSRIRTKGLIADYLREIRRCIALMANEGSKNTNITKKMPGGGGMISSQDKRTLLRDMQSSLGKTTLMLQGGALVSMCHLGVAKALHEQGLLPRIITGTGTGALVASLLGSASQADLGDMLRENRIDLTAFTRARAARRATNAKNTSTLPRWWQAFVRRARRLARTGHFFDISVLSDCARDNLGDLTFEEAYQKSGLVLNITIAMPEVAGTPVLLNYITAPHVLVWSAVAASVATSKKLYAPAHLYCKDDTGQVKRYYAADATETPNKRVLVHPGTALERIGELFNVDHFIISQTRPYIIPFVKFQEAADGWLWIGKLVQFLFSELVHWLYVLKWIGLLPTFLQRILIDETLPTSETWSKIVICPRLSFRDYFAVFDLPSPQKIENLAAKGERSVWPKICQLRVRCATEFEIDSAIQSYSRVTE